MNRRKAIRYLFITGTAVWAFPSCVSESARGEGQLLSSSQQKLLEDLADAIIPSTTSPGAKELGVHHFIEKMLQDCRGPEYQNSFKAGLDKFQDFAKNKKNKGWASLSGEEKQQLLEYGASSENKDADIRTCINGVRELTITGYKSSQYYLTKVQEYKLVPGYFHGCVEISGATKS